MKKLALLSVGALILASTVFAPVAQAQQPGEVDIQSVSLVPDPNGWWTVTGTIECVEGSRYDLAVGVFLNIKKPSEKKFKEIKDKKKRTPGENFTISQDFADCTITGPQPFTLRLIPLFSMTEKDKVWVVAQGEVCVFEPVFFCREGELVSERVK